MLGLGLSLPVLAIMPRPVAAPVAVPALGYTLLAGFETPGTATASNNLLSQHSGSRRVLGSAGLRMQGTGVNLAQGANAIATTSADFAALGHTRVLFSLDMGEAAINPLSIAKPRFVAGSTTYDARFDAGVTAFAEALPQQRGRVWVSYALSELRNGSYAGASVLTAGTASKRFDLTVNAASVGTYAVDAVVDAAVFPADYKPAIVLTFDDANKEQYDNLFPHMQGLGLKGSLYLPRNAVEASAGLVASGGKLTNGQIAAMRAAGWCIAVDSDPDDKPLTAYPTVAAAIAQLNAHRDAIAAQWGDSEGGRHLCYSYGNIGYPDTPQAFSCTSNGTTTLTSASTGPYTHLAPGMYIFNAAKVLLGLVASVTGQSAFTASAPIAAATQTLTFVGATGGVAAVCNGTATVTGTNTDHMVPGMEVLGYTVPAGTTIVSVESATQFTASAAIPATCVRLRAAHTAGEFWPTKLLDALIAAGYRTGRRNVGGCYATPYGADPRVQIVTPSYSMDYVDSATTANLLRQIDACVAAGRDMVLYGHKPASAEMAAHWQPIMAKVKALVDAGSAECLTLSQWHARVYGRGAIA